MLKHVNSGLMIMHGVTLAFYLLSSLIFNVNYFFVENEITILRSRIVEIICCGISQVSLCYVLGNLGRKSSMVYVSANSESNMPELDSYRPTVVSNSEGCTTNTSESLSSHRNSYTEPNDSSTHSNNEVLIDIMRGQELESKIFI